MANGTTTHQLVDQFVDIAKAVDVIEDRLDFIVDRAELGDTLCEANEIAHRVQALLARVSLAATNNNVPAEHGQRTVGQFVAARTNSRGVEVNLLLRSAKWLRDFPIFEAAFGSVLTNAHIQHMRKHLNGTFETRRRLRHDQQFFVDTASRVSYTQFETVCEYWLRHIDPDGKEPIDQLERSGLRIGKGQGGRGEIQGQCDAITRQILDTAIEHEANALRRADVKAGVERSDSQRRMAALSILVQRGFRREDGSYPVPLVNIVMSQKVADWAAGQLNGDAVTDTVPVDAFDVDSRCELIDGTPIHPFLAMLAIGNHGFDHLGQPNLRRHVLEADSRVLDVSVNARSFPEWQRTAALISTRGGCGTHGCEAPHSWIEMDHVQPVFHGGETKLENGDPLCRPDNQSKGATPGLVSWRDRPEPPRRRPRPRGTASNTDTDDDDSAF